MAPLGVWWGIAGGWAIDLWLGEITRDHHDVEVVVRRSDQVTVHAALNDEWSLMCLDPPGSQWRTWSGGEELVVPSFQAKAQQSSVEFDIFLEDCDDEAWRFRRDPRIQRQISGVLVGSASGVPVVRPEIQLLYMAKSEEAKNQHDFEKARPRLGADAVSWLRSALLMTYPEHSWIGAL
jgi:hypothetical protein